MPHLAEEIKKVVESGRLFIFELPTDDGGYDVYDIHLTENGWLSATNGNNKVSLRVDKDFTLDEHLQMLYDLIVEK